MCENAVRYITHLLPFRRTSHFFLSTFLILQPIFYTLFCFLEEASDDLCQFGFHDLLSTDPFKKLARERALGGAQYGTSPVCSQYDNWVPLVPNTPSIDIAKDHDPIRYVDLTTSMPTETPDPFGEPARGFGGLEIAQGIVH